MRKKSKFLTFVFTMLPGAGHMYLGFMKMGISIMSCFFAILCFSMIVHFSPLLFIVPVIWFYSFFDALNKNGLPDEEFYALEDKFILNIDSEGFKDFQLGKFRLIIAVALILIGCNLLLSNILDVVYRILPPSVEVVLRDFFNMLPELFVGMLIIFIGVKLILGKNSELKKEAMLPIVESEEINHDENA